MRQETNNKRSMLTDNRVGKAVARLNKPWLHTASELSFAAHQVLLLVTTLSLAQQVLELLHDDEDLQKFVIDTLRFNVLKVDLRYHTSIEFVRADIKSLALSCAGKDDRESKSTNSIQLDELKVSKGDNLIQFIGYYPANTIRIDNENKRITEANELASKLQASFIKSINDGILPCSVIQELSSSTLLFKNRQKSLIAYDHKKKIARLTEVMFDRDSLCRLNGYCFPYFTPGESFILQKKSEEQEVNTEQTLVNLDVKSVVVQNSKYFYVVSYSGADCLVEMLPYEIDLYKSSRLKKKIRCLYKGLNKEGIPHLIQDRGSQIVELYEEDTVQEFTYLFSKKGYRKNGEEYEYHVFLDGYGLKHSYSGELSAEQKKSGTKIQFYIKGLNPKNNTLFLAVYDPKITRLIKEWYDADRVFGEIDEMANKEELFDVYLSKDKNLTKLDKDLQEQYNERNNLWLFTFLNILDNEIIPSHTRKHEIEELAIASSTMIKLQKWLVEGSNFLDLFNEETREDSIKKSGFQIQKYNRLLLAIDVVRRGKQDEYVKDITEAIERSGRIALNREERLEVLIDILRIYPGYLTQDIEKSCLLIKSLLKLKENIDSHYLTVVSLIIDHSIEEDTRQIRKSTYRSNDIDMSQTVLIYEVLALLMLKAVMLSDKYNGNELEARTAKARFFRNLSFIATPDVQSKLIDAGVNALVGVLNDDNIFTWENILHISPIDLCNITLQSTVLDNNLSNDYCFFKHTGKSGVVILDPTGFTITPYKQCLGSMNHSYPLISEIRPIHHLESLPVKIGSMYNVQEVTMPSNAVEQFLLWKNMTKRRGDAAEILDTPKVGDKVKVLVKEQAQKDNLKNMLFITVIDSRYQKVDGVIMIQEISTKWVDDVRTLFEAGDTFYATVIYAKDDKYNFSIKDDVSQFATEDSSIADDLKKIKTPIGIEESRMLPKAFVEELVLLIDMRIRKETSEVNKNILTGYAYCLSAIIGDTKSYYYDFMLRYYASVEKFLSNSYQNVEISFHDTSIDDKFADLSNKKKFVEFLQFASSEATESIIALQNLINDSDSDVGKLAATILSYNFAKKADFDDIVISGIRDEIRKRINASGSLNLNLFNIKPAVIEEKNSTKETIAIANNSDEGDDEFQSSEVEQASSDTQENDEASLNVFSKNVETDVVFGSDKTFTIVEHSNQSENDSNNVVIRIPSNCHEGNLLIVTNDYLFTPMSISEIKKMPYGEQQHTDISCFRIKNHFIAPADAIAGLIINSEQGSFLKMVEFAAGQTYKMLPDNITASEIRNCQPFVLPKTCLEEQSNELIGSTLKIEDIDNCVVEKLQTYDVFIR